MDNLPKSCGNTAKNLSINHSTTCEHSSTNTRTGSRSAQNHVNKHQTVHKNSTLTPHYLFTPKNALNNLLFTRFTQLPQPLLLLKRKKI